MTGRVLGALLLVAAGVPAPARAQSSLAGAAERVRRAWLAHDVQAIVGQSPRVVLQIPGADPSAPVERAQAVELLRRHLQRMVERALAVGAVREVEPGHGYVELDRRYVVAGTSDERRETIFLRFRRPGADWLLTELRSAP
ncbi:MAG TPA: hypothetical protein VJJ54_03650 [Gemmatimonadales bacterium]|nr:hypothetical protein [Gemmatimonadales bacterium]